MNQAFKAVSMKGSADVPHPVTGLSGLVPSLRVAVGTEGLELYVGLLNMSATHFDTSGHSAPSVLQVLGKHVFTSQLTRHEKPANFQHNAQSQLFYCLI